MAKDILNAESSGPITYMFMMVFVLALSCNPIKKK